MNNKKLVDLIDETLMILFKEVMESIEKQDYTRRCNIEVIADRLKKIKSNFIAMEKCKEENCNRKVIHLDRCQKHLNERYKMIAQDNLKDVKSLLFKANREKHTYDIYYYDEYNDRYYHLGLGSNNECPYWSAKRLTFWSDPYATYSDIIKSLGKYLFNDESRFKIYYLD